MRNLLVIPAIYGWLAGWHKKCLCVCLQCTNWGRFLRWLLLYEDCMLINFGEKLMLKKNTHVIRGLAGAMSVSALALGLVGASNAYAQASGAYAATAAVTYNSSSGGNNPTTLATIWVRKTRSAATTRHKCLPAPATMLTQA